MGLQAAGRIYPAKKVACRRVVVNRLLAALGIVRRTGKRTGHVSSAQERMAAAQIVRPHHKIGVTATTGLPD
jgi:hypothetical protein